MPVPDFSPGEVLTAQAMDSIGLWKVTSGSFTNQTQLLVDGCFNADFENYRVVLWNLTTASANELRLQFRTAVPANIATNNDFAAQFQDWGAALLSNTSAAQTSSYLLFCGTGKSSITLDFWDPFAASACNFGGNGVANGGSWVLSGRCTNTTSKAGFRIFHVATQNFSGEYAVYGYRN